MPVVWCSDPNSSSKKPTAFALQGIQLQGNISEQHVLAVREFINAASQGQLLLPANGGIVMLDCGVGVGSVIIQERSNSREHDSANKENERSQAVNEIVQQKLRLHKTDAQKKSSESREILYEFLCCARCMNDGARCCNRNSTAHSSKIVAKFLDVKMSTGRANRRPGNAMRPISSRRKNTVSFKSEKRPLRRIQASGNSNKMPVYATVNKQQKQKNRGKKQPSQIDQPEPIVNDAIEASTVNRKTSFDSTCTVSSMDSGFMDMQNRLEIARKSQEKIECEIQIKIDASEETDMVDSTETLPSSWSRLNIPSQSRNRRKSYEEFKLLFCDTQKQPPPTSVRLDVKSSIKSRRKSYEEFKSVTSILCDNSNNKSSNDTIANELIVKNDLTTAAVDENSSGFFKMKRKNSKRVSARKTSPKFSNKTVNQKIEEDVKSPQSSTIYDILRKNSVSNVSDANEAKVNYDKNLELFKSHCSKNNIKDFDNLISCGTIYDIIQRKSDIYTKNFKRYDKYMTYGTLYEILHRKTGEDDQFERKRTLSEKFSNKRINYAHIDFKTPAEDHNKIVAAAATDMGEENLNSTSTTTSASSMKQGSGTANNQLSITSVGSQLSTIYDILQTKKLESPAGRRNRFLVRKITEEDLIDAQKENEVEKVVEKVTDNAAIELPQPKAPSEQKKQNRIRRFSNILSYTPKATVDSAPKVPPTPTEAEKKTNVHLEAKIDELYSRLNRITQQNETQQKIESEKEKEPSKIFKSNSLDMLSTLNENEALATRQRPLRKISVPTHQQMKALPKKSTRRLSEFTRGEFLNEKS